MRMAFVVGLILLFVLAPVYVVPHLFKTNSSQELVFSSARDIIAKMPILEGDASITVAPFENDYKKSLQLALVHELRKTGQIRVTDDEIFARGKWSINKLIRQFKDTPKEITTAQLKSDAVLTGRIQRNEMPGAEYRLHLTAMIVETRSGEVLWTTAWQGTVSLSGSEWEFKKTALLICLAIAAGIVVIYARQEDRKQAA